MIMAYMFTRRETLDTDWFKVSEAPVQVHFAGQCLPSLNWYFSTSNITSYGLNRTDIQQHTYNQ